MNDIWCTYEGFTAFSETAKISRSERIPLVGSCGLLLQNGGEIQIPLITQPMGWLLWLTTMSICVPSVPFQTTVSLL